MICSPLAADPCYGTGRTPTPNGPPDQIMDAIDRVPIDGKTVVRTKRTIDKEEPFYQLHYPFSETDFPPAGRGPSAWR